MASVRERKARTGTSLPPERILAHHDVDRPLTAVVDASVIVAALVADGPARRWAEALVAEQPLAATTPHARRGRQLPAPGGAAGDLSDDIATLAHADLV